jgi:hypothetical protein
MAQITVDTKESLDAVLQLIGAAYGVKVGVVDSDAAAPARATSARRPRRGGRPARTTAAPARTTTRRRRGAAASSASSADVRAWAREHGHTVSDRGRLPAPILEAYRAARS